MRTRSADAQAVEGLAEVEGLGVQAGEAQAAFGVEEDALGGAGYVIFPAIGVPL